MTELERYQKVFNDHSAAFDAMKRGEKVAPKDLDTTARNRATIIASCRDLVMNSNTVPTGLKRSAILQEVVRDFARRIVPVTAGFSTVFQSVPLEGDNKVQVPYYDLDASASTSFNSDTGYAAGNTVTAVREIQVGKRAVADVADDTKQYDRKYQGLSLSSHEVQTQPGLKIVELARQKSEKLCSDVVTHILSIITAAKFGEAVKTEDADTFDSDDVIDVKLACKLWPKEGRSLILDSAYDANLLKDPAFKVAYTVALERAVKEGQVFPRIQGFDYAEYPTIPENGENLVGWAAYKSEIGIAFAPVPPSIEVQNAGTTWEFYTDPASGVTLEYRTFGNPALDAGFHFIESSYGFERLNANALKRICRP